MDQVRRDPSSRVPWLMRDAIGHSDVMGIRTLVRPALCAAPAAQARAAFSSSSLTLTLTLTLTRARTLTRTLTLTLP